VVAEMFQVVSKQIIMLKVITKALQGEG